MLPTVITGLKDDSTCMQEEIFGEYSESVTWYGMVQCSTCDYARCIEVWCWNTTFHLTAMDYF
jgi:hypothetical protein